MVVVIADKIPHIIGIFSKDARIYDLIRLAWLIIQIQMRTFFFITVKLSP